MEGGSQWCGVQAQLDFSPLPYHLLLLVAKANHGCFDSCMHSAEGHLFNTFSYFICLYLFYMFIFIFYVYMFIFSVPCWHLFVMVHKNRQKPESKGREEISDFYQLIQQGNWYSITGQKQKQKRIPPSEQKFSTCQIPRAFSGLSRHFFSKEVPGKISRWWKTTSGRERPPRNKQANTNVNNESKNEAFLHWFLSLGEWYQC